MNLKRCEGNFKSSTYDKTGRYLYKQHAAILTRINI